MWNESYLQGYGDMHKHNFNEADNEFKGLPFSLKAVQLYNDELCRCVASGIKLMQSKK